ncbi:MAG: TcpQ domain-containing protein, partial [Pseudomonadota bacterium]
SAYASLYGYYAYDPEFLDFFHAIVPPLNTFFYHKKHVNIPYATDKFGHQLYPNLNPITVIIQPGSLRANVVRILRRYKWSVVWKPGVDYRFIGRVKLRAYSIQAIMDKLLQNYPLQAIFYQGNRVVLIQSRVIA